MGKEVSAAKTQWLHTQALEKIAPSYHPDARITRPKQQHPIMDDGPRTQLFDPKTATAGSFQYAFGKKYKRKGGGPKLAGSLRERIVLRSLLPDSLKMECLERLDKMEKEQEEKAAELHAEGHESKSAQRRRSICGPPPIPGGFHEGQPVMARRDLYLEGDHIMAAFMDKAVVLGPSRSSDRSRVCVKFQERRDGGTMWVNVMPDEIMSEENGALMRKYIEIGKLRRRKPPPPPTPELEAPPDGIHYHPETEPCFEELRVVPWTSSARGDPPWVQQGGSPCQKMDKGKWLRDSRSLPALLGGLTVAYVTT
mmetsp:Transcript_95508/g.116969  ORF Transcript_95508/g.116969 Transcript_95508/m.116969 type:complete len:310 (-) Transcript_95508:62-991(-)